VSALTESTGVAPGTLEAIAREAAALDADPAFPEAAFERLAADGALALTAGDRHPGRAREWATVRAVARADGSVGRIFEGHLNGVERIAVAAPEPLRSAELAAVRDGRLRLGVWGADPTPEEGAPGGAGTRLR